MFQLFSSYSPEKVFEVVADVEKYPDFVPWCVSAHDLSDLWRSDKERLVNEEEDWNTIRYLQMSAGFQLIHDQYVSKVCTKDHRVIKVLILIISNNPIFQYLITYLRFSNNTDHVIFTMNIY